MIIIFLICVINANLQRLTSLAAPKRLAAL
jgi:hypothetical protein